MTFTTDKLTKNQLTVLNLLEKSDEPLKAYSILFNTQQKGMKSPLQIYRALDKLIELGKVHKIESKNSFIVCKNSNCNSYTSTSFIICEKCEKVTEIKDKNLSVFFAKISTKNNLKYNKHNLEIYGSCKNCKSKNIS